MKVNKNSVSTGFKPISVTVTIETEEELNALIEFTSFAITLPEKVFSKNSSKFIITSNFLTEFHKAL